MATKHYYEQGDKFWETWVEGANLFTRHGKRGANGQTKIKSAKTAAAATALQTAAVAAKTKEGYAKPGGATKKAAAPVVDEVPAGATRLQLVEGTSAKFWQVQRADSTVTVTFGKLGTLGQTQVKKFPETWAARSHVDTLIAEKKKKGYAAVLTGKQAPASPVASDPRLEKAIFANPDSDDGFMVYADFLQEQGDVRGALAVIQAQLDTHPEDKKLDNAQRKLLWEHRAHFYGPLASYRHPKKNAAIHSTWRQGWMDCLTLSSTSSYDVADGTPTVQNVAELVRALPEVRSAKFIRELILAKPVADDEYDFGDAIKELVKIAASLPLLRKLTIGQFGYEDSELSWSHAGDLSALWRAFPKLESLLVHAGSMSFGKIDAPNLRSFRVETGGLGKKSLASILDAKAPKLETLNLWFGQVDYGFDCKLADMVKLLDAQRFPKLKHLGIANSIYGDELAPHVATAPILRQLETLDLSRSHLTIDGVRALASHAQAFAHLQKLDLSECLLDKAGQKLAKTLCKTVDLSEQEDRADHQPDDDGDPKDLWWRYTAVGE